jgi:phage baseplate assembly protein W
MAYQIIPASNILQENEIGFGVSFTSTNPSSVFQTLYTTNDQAKENLKTLLLTRKGERYMQLDFGTDLLSAIFQPNLTSIKTEIQELIRNPINYWLPYINIESIDIITNEDDPTMIHNIKITLNYSVDNLETNTITIFGNDNSVAIS